jgi:ribosomal protein L37AE/L43A
LTDAREQGGNMARKIGTTSRRIPKSKFDVQETHKCPRCNAFLVHERFYGMCAHIWVWRCIKCGEVIDDVVLYNRRLLKKAAKGIDIMTLIR